MDRSMASRTTNEHSAGTTERNATSGAGRFSKSIPFAGGGGAGRVSGAVVGGVVGAVVGAVAGPAVNKPRHDTYAAGTITHTSRPSASAIASGQPDPDGGSRSDEWSVPRHRRRAMIGTDSARHAPATAASGSRSRGAEAAKIDIIRVRLTVPPRLGGVRRSVRSVTACRDCNRPPSPSYERHVSPGHHPPQARGSGPPQAGGPRRAPEGDDRLSPPPAQLLRRRHRPRAVEGEPHRRGEEGVAQRRPDPG